MRRIFVFSAMSLFVLLIFSNCTLTDDKRTLLGNQISEAALPGFGDRQNSTAWSMKWWRGKLYVGTLRSFVCWRAAMLASKFPRLAQNFYPPRAPDADCTPDLTDLPLQAEIWRWTPESEKWERVYQSPQDVPIPGHPGKFVARDTGFRGMLIFTEADGTEAMYVSGVSPRELYNDSTLPPPRLLRTTDGVTFTPVPQDPDTFLGNLQFTSLRSGTIYNGRMYLTNGSARGEGILIESQNPSGGNNNFRTVMQPGTTVWDATPFNGFLYIGVTSKAGFQVVKTDAQGEAPYSVTTVITAGGYLKSPSPSIVSFQVYNDRLYVGTYEPAELYRINPDDTWELVVGAERDTPTGRQSPISGLEAGFGWPYNVQIYRMHVENGILYVGTLDTSRDLTEATPNDQLDKLLRWQYGFDLYQSEGGRSFEPITINGLGDPFQIAVRTFTSTPYGTFMGTGSYWYGLRIWRRLPDMASSLYLPLVQNAPQTEPGRTIPSVVQVATVDSTARSACASFQLKWLVADKVGKQVVISWAPSPRATRVHIYRSGSMPVTELWGLNTTGKLPTEFQKIGVTTAFFYVDPDTTADQIYHYFVVGEDANGCLSSPSNLVRMPSLAPKVTFGRIEAAMRDWLTQNTNVTQASNDNDMIKDLRIAQAYLEQGDIPSTLNCLATMRIRLVSHPPVTLPAWRLTDLEELLMSLERRIRLAKIALLPMNELELAEN